MTTELEIAATPSKVLLALASKLEARLITRTNLENDLEEPYLWRAYLGLKDTEDIGGFLHRFVASDQAHELHCHPWAWSLSFILDGSYEEHNALGTFLDTEQKQVVLRSPIYKMVNAGDRNLILANTFHRVELVSPEVWTLFIHGPRVQRWGFVPVDRYNTPLPIRLVEGRTKHRAQKGDMETVE